MTREEYLQELELRLSHRMPPQEVERLMSYYTEYFNEAGPGNEDRVMAELGSPERLTRRIVGEQVVDELERRQPDQPYHSGGLKAVLAVLLAVCAAPVAIPLVIAAVAVVAALVLALLCLVVGVGVGTVICLIAGGVIIATGFSALLTHGLATTMYFVGGGMLGAGLGLVLLAGALWFSGLCFRGMAKLLGRLLRGRRAEA